MKHQHDMLDWSKSFMYSIHQTHFLIEKHLEQQLAAKESISFAQFLVLLPVRYRKHVSQSDIADATYLTEATVSRHVTAMTEEGLLTRKEDPENRRKHILELTTKGESELDKAQRVIEEVLKNVFDAVPAKDRTLITHAFDQVLVNLLKSIT